MVSRTGKALHLSILKDLYTIHRFPADHGIPALIDTGDFFSISKSFVD